MLTSLDKFDHAAIVGCCARRAEISVALPPKSDTGYARANKIDDVSAVLRHGVVSTTSELREHGRDDAVP